MVGAEGGDAPQVGGAEGGLQLHAPGRGLSLKS
jgi:hypothetical protein